ASYVNAAVMRIFHASAANRKKPYDSYTNGAFYSVLTRFLTGVRVKSQKSSQFSVTGATIDRSHNLKSEEYC
ncbi:hypothetical protein, partial [Escherichia coli]|uniref:hypothetical protein n=3 Tax=Enterobacteriaceae TaxID=543 RepID=UPI003D2EC1B1